jgi:hypothetical protein
LPPLLTIFSAPKPFTSPHINLIQRNALQSWRALGPEVEVFLVGEEEGLTAAACDYGIPVLTPVRRNEAGTPLVSSIFELARQACNSPFLLYVNADVLLLPDLIAAARQISSRVEHFLLIGQRWDLDVQQPLFFGSGWDRALRAMIQERGRLHLPAGSDYFLFPRQLFTEMPDFAIGRAGWDNWMIYHARRQNWCVIDGTPSVMVIHQDHDYSHLPGGKPHYTIRESQQNEAMAGGSANLYMVLDSDQQLVNGHLQAPKLTFIRALRRAEIALTPTDGSRRGGRWWLARRYRRLRRRITGSLV